MATESMNNDICFLSLNINGGLQDKISEVDLLLSIHEPIALLLQDLKMSAEKADKCENLFKGYKLVHHCPPATESVSLSIQRKRTQIRKNKRLSPAEKSQALATLEEELPRQAYVNTSLACVIREDIAPTVTTQGDKNYRWQRLSFTGLNTEIINVYAPQDQKGKDELWTELEKIVADNNRKKIKTLLGGDWNMIFDDTLDKMSEYENPRDRNNRTFIEFCEKTHLTDIFRKVHPNKREWTWARTCANSGRTTTSRLDMFLTNGKATKLALDSEPISKKIVQSDHRAVAIYLSPAFLNVEEVKCPLKSNEKPRRFTITPETSNKFKEEAEKLLQDLQYPELNGMNENQKRERMEQFLHTRIQHILQAAETTLKEKKAGPINRTQLDEETGRLYKRKIKIERIREEYVHTRVNGTPDYTHINRRIDNFNAKLGGNLVHFTGGEEVTAIDRLSDAERLAHREYQHEIRRLRRIQIDDRIGKLRELEKTNPKKFYQKVCNVLRPVSKYASPVKEKLQDGKVIFHRDEENAKRVTKKFWEDMAQQKTPPSGEAKFSVFGTPRPPEQNTGKENLTAPITDEEFEEALSSLKKGKATGVDLIQGELIRLYGPEQKKALRFLFDFCLQHQWIPMIWKKGRIFLIHKGGATSEPTNYRPISLLSIEYKMLTGIITKRTYAFVENNTLLHASQAGFRPGHGTHDHLRTIINIIEDSHKHKKELHLCYVDFRKAYDVTEHWAIERALEFHGFPKEYISLIRSLNKDLKSDVICDYGITEEFDVLTGVRQGDGLSPLLFILTLDPLLRALDDTNNCYEISDKKIGNLAFADDVILIAKNQNGLNEKWQKIQLYGDLFGLKVNPTKCAYTYHYTETAPPLLTARTHTGELANIPLLRANEHYRYLGIQLSLNLDWNKSIEEHAHGYRQILSLLRQKSWLNQDQKIRIVNMVANAAVKYAAKVIPFPRQWTKKLDTEARLAIFRKNNMSANWCYMDKRDGGRGLEPLSETVEELYASAIIYNGLKSKNEITQVTTKSRVKAQLQQTVRTKEVHNPERPSELEDSEPERTDWDQRNSIERSLALLRERNFDVKVRNAPNPLRQILLRDLNHEPIAADWTPLQHLVVATANRKISIQEKYFNQDIPLEVILTEDKLDRSKTECLLPGPDQEREIFQRLLCVNDEGDLRPELRKILNRTQKYYDPTLVPTGELRTEDFKEIDGTLAVATDGSSKDNKAGFGIWCGPNSPWNHFGQVRNEQNNATAELTALLVALEMLPPRLQGYTFLVDAESWMTQITRYPKMRHQERMRVPYSHLVATIFNVIQNRHNNTIVWRHVYSHVSRKIKTAKEEQNDRKLQRIKNHMDALGKHADFAITANEGADKLASLGRALGATPVDVIPEDTDPFFVTNQNKFFQNYVPSAMKMKRFELYRERFLGSPSGRLFALEYGNINKQLSFNNPFDDLPNKAGRNYVLAAARTDTLTLGHKYSKIYEANPQSWLISEDRETSGFCPKGCRDSDGHPIPERAQHFFNDCPRWDDHKKLLFENIKHLIRMQDPSAHTELLPCWFLRREARPEMPPALCKHINKLAQFSTIAGILAFCPIDLEGALEEIGSTGGRGARGKVVGQIMSRLSNFIFETYAFAYPKQQQTEAATTQTTAPTTTTNDIAQQ